MITIQTYSPATGETITHGPFEIGLLEIFISKKIRQFLRVKRLRKHDNVVLFSYGVLPPVKERTGAFTPAGVVMMKDGMPHTLKITRFVGTLGSLAEPSTYRRYIRYENGAQ